MFLDNKYTRWYYAIIKHAQESVQTGYTESHHIVPHSLGGSHLSANRVRLTAREHYVCHRLLTKMTVGRDRQRMWAALHAISRMGSKNNDRSTIRVTSHVFAQLREEHAKHIGLIWKGKKRSAESRAKMSAAQRGRVTSDEAKAKLSALMKDREHTWGSKIGDALKSYHASKTEVYKCMHCKAESKIKGNITRWHNDNCKLK